MATCYHPNIVTNGLQLYLDAANKKSYSYSENLLFYTSSIGDSSYAVGATVTLNAAIAPDGTYTATFIDQGASVNNYVFSNLPSWLTVNTTYTYSIHIKSGNTADYQITIDENGFGGKRYYVNFTYATQVMVTGISGAVNDGYVVGSTYSALPNGWYRLSLTFHTSTTAVNGFVDMIARYSGPGQQYVWGRQLEKGTVTNTYTATTASIVNRSTTWNDISGNGNHFTLYNSPTFTGNGFTFDGINQYAQATNTTIGNFGSSSFTLEYCVYYTTVPSNFNCLLMKRGAITSIGAINSNGWAHRMAPGGISYFVQDNNPGAIQSNIVYMFNSSLNTSAYTHYVLSVTRSGLNAIGNVYINGTLSQTQTINYVGTGDITNASPLSMFYTLGENVYMPGSIYFTRIYNIALSSTQVQQNFCGLRGRFSI